MKIKGFTLLEALVVIVIVGVLAILYIPNMQGPIEKSRSKNAVFNLQSIYSAQKRYLLNERAYFTSNDTDSINQNLSIKIDDPYFTYNITPSGSGYLATAVRIDGKCKGAKMTIMFDNSTVNKTGCAAW